MPYSVETLKKVFRSKVTQAGFPCCCYDASAEFLRLYGETGDKMIGGIYSSIGDEYMSDVCDDFKDLETCQECGGLVDECCLNRHYWVERYGEIIDLTAYQFSETFKEKYCGERYTENLARFLTECNNKELPGIYIPLSEEAII